MAMPRRDALRRDVTSPKRARGRPARLSRELVVATAVDLVRSGSLADVTMRALADRLDATPMALYRHVGDREELALLVVDAVFSTLALPDDALPTLDWLRELARAIRALGRAHPGVMDVLLEEGPAVTSTLVVLDAVVRKLHDAGVSWKEATGIHNTFLSWVAAAVHREERWALRASAAPPLFQRFLSAARAMPEADYPGLAHALSHMPGASVDTEFEYSLSFMLGAVEARIADARGAVTTRRAAPSSRGARPARTKR